jgi:hypothetical protein
MLNGFQEKLTLLHTSLIIKEMTTLMTELQLKTSLFNVPGNNDPYLQIKV